ncbi:MAG: Gfo/Idh/MocA family protein [Vicinamibacterales bacterium]
MTEPAQRHPRLERVGIIGLGSIGRRHARLLRALLPDVRIQTHRTRLGALQDNPEDVEEIDRATFYSSRFDLVVISNPSSMHLDTLRDVLKAHLAPIVLMEKPFCVPEEEPAAREIIARHADVRIVPGNKLRFHPAITGLKAIMAAGALGRALECHAHFGTFMPGWHPYEDYRQTYASRRELGGGVLLTSIHEIDLMHHLFGDGIVHGASVRRLALHETDVEDAAHLLMSLDRCPIANVSLNFFERPADRYCKVVFERGVWSWRFGQPEVSVTEWHGDTPTTASYPVDPGVDAMYVEMWSRLLEATFDDFELESVFASLETIAAARALSEEATWK